MTLPDRTLFPETQNYKYSSVRMILVKLINNFDLNDGVEYIDGMYEHWERDYYIEVKNLQAGKYMAFVEFDWHDSVRPEQQEFSFNCYGMGISKINDVTEITSKQAFLKEAFVSKLSKNRVGINRMDFTEKGAKEIKRYF